MYFTVTQAGITKLAIPIKLHITNEDSPKYKVIKIV